MCAPALALVASIGSSVAGFAAQQADYANKAYQWQQNYVNSLVAGAEEHQQLLIRHMQEENKFADAQHQTALQVAARSADVAASETAQGSYGNTSDALASEVIRQGSRVMVNNEINWRYTAQQLTEEQRGVVTKEESRINSVERPIAPSPLALAAGILGAGVKFAGQTGLGVNYQASAS